MATIKKYPMFSIRLQPRERAELDRLARCSGRTKTAVIRRLLTLADKPEGRAALGITEPKEGNHDGTKEQRV